MQASDNEMNKISNINPTDNKTGMVSDNDNKTDKISDTDNKIDKASDSGNKTDNVSNSDNTKKKKSGNKRWLEMICFLLVYCIIIRIISYATDPIRLKQPTRVIDRDIDTVAAFLEEEDSMDVLFIGDSEAMVLVSPWILMEEAGISSYNCNQLGQRLHETYSTLEKLLKKQHPKVIFLETNVLIHEVSLRIEPQNIFNSMTQEALPLLSYHKNWRIILGLSEVPEYNAYKGYEDILVVDPYSGEEWMHETEESFPLNPITIYYMNKIRTLCEERNIPLILVSAPSPINMDYPKHNAIQSYADTYGLEYIDFNLKCDEIGIDWSNDTGDAGDHINKYGAEKTTRYLMDYLNDNYDLPDHRQD